MQVEGKRRAAGARHLHRAQVVARHQLAGQVLEHPRLQIGEALGQAEDQPPPAGDGADELDQLLHREDLRPAQLVALAASLGLVQREMQRARDVADIHRLERRASGHGTANTGSQRVNRAKRLRKVSSGPNTTEGRNTVTSRSSAASSARSPMPLERRYSEGALGRSAQRADMQQPAHAVRAAGGDDGLRQLDMHAREIRAVVVRPALVAPAAAPVEDADQVVDRVLAGAQPLEHAGRHDVGLDHVDRRQQDEVLGALAAARGDRDAHAGGGERRDQVAADEARAAHHQHVAVLHAPIIAARRLAPHPRWSAARRRPAAGSRRAAS